MNRTVTPSRLLACGTGALALLAACDADPASTNPPPLAVSVTSDSIIARQGSIRVRVPGGVDPNTALNPENFVVINTCNGLRVSGSLRLAGDTVIFSPSQSIPFLTTLSVRVQNLLTSDGRQLEQPFTFGLRTEDPPVRDVSWERLNSPTNDFVGGLSFANRSTGYMVTIAGGLYRTDNGGDLFGAVFKDLNINNLRDIRTVSPTEAFVSGTQRVGTAFDAVLLRTTNAGVALTPILRQTGANFFSLSMYPRTQGSGTNRVFVLGGNLSNTIAAFRYDFAKDSLAVFAPGGLRNFGQMADLSPDGNAAALVGFNANAAFTQLLGIAYRSTNGGRSYTAVTLPATTPAFRGVGFLNNTEALLLGDTSTVLRLNTATGTFTALGAANGIPQTELGPQQGQITTYTFTRYTPAPDDPTIGWLVGTLTRRVPGQADVRRGVILQTRDGGQTFTRQAVSQAEENGLGFPGLRDVYSLSKDFSLTGGENGFISARKSDSQNFARACSFSSGPNQP